MNNYRIGLFVPSEVWTFRLFSSDCLACEGFVVFYSSVYEHYSSAFWVFCVEQCLDFILCLVPFLSFECESGFDGWGDDAFSWNQGDKDAQNKTEGAVLFHGKKILWIFFFGRSYPALFIYQSVCGKGVRTCPDGLRKRIIRFSKKETAVLDRISVDWQNAIASIIEPAVSWKINKRDFV